MGGCCAKGKKNYVYLRSLCFGMSLVILLLTYEVRHVQSTAYTTNMSANWFNSSLLIRHGMNFFSALLQNFIRLQRIIETIYIYIRDSNFEHYPLSRSGGRIFLHLYPEKVKGEVTLTDLLERSGVNYWTPSRTWTMYVRVVLEGICHSLGRRSLF